MSNFTTIMNYLLSLSVQERGIKFERYCKWLLENDSQYKMLLKQVWLWKDWPGNWGRDKGIDLIAETYNGEIWAIQAKAYHEDYYVTKEDIDRFLSESSRKIISYRLLIATTNNIGQNALDVATAQEKSVGLFLRDNFESSSLDWSVLLEGNATFVKPVQKIPKTHQEMAINAVLEGFKQSSFGQLYMACGTGKTLVGLWLAERLQSKNTLVLVSSISLVAQLFREWSDNSASDFEPIFICHDKTVGRNKDEQDQMVMSNAELGFLVMTDVQEFIKKFTSSNRHKVVFATYHSSPVLAKACALNASIIFDLTIADEAHRCAGPARSDFATIVDNDAIRTKYKLFMTATPKIFSGHVKQKTQKVAYDIVSMDEEEEFGPVFHKLLFSEAIRQNLLSDYQVIVSVMDDATYREYAEKGRFVSFNDYQTDARTLASQLLVAKAIKEFDLKKVISFHNKKRGQRNLLTPFLKHY